VVVAVVRDPSVLYNPAPGTVLAAADQIVLMGSRPQLAAAHETLSEIQTGAQTAQRTPRVVS
jgi:K+/H+ antiporter YhaU regulatory subunit KhtT